MVILITQNIYVKIIKYPPIKILFFVLSNVKIIILLYMEMEKAWNTLV
jgi:hypothetical protein